MPIAQRTVEPTLVYQSRGLTSNLPPSLPSTSLVALTSIIRQLSVLSKYADELFGDVFNEASKYVYRSNKLEERVAALALALQERRADENMVLRDLPAPTQEKPEQHILNVYIPRALKEKYHACDRPPPLGVFVRLRSDGRDGMALYTDPTLFFRQWLYNMNREANVLRNPNKKRLRRSRSTMRPGQPLYIAPPSASPPPPLAYPVYENREQEAAAAAAVVAAVEEEEEEGDQEDNIYEMLPERDYSPPATHSSPHLHTSQQFNQPVHCNQSYQFNQSACFASSPQHQLSSPDTVDQRHDLNASHDLPSDLPHDSYDHGNSFQRNRSYDMSMQLERQVEKGGVQQFSNSEEQFDNIAPLPRLNTSQQRYNSKEYGAGDSVLPLQTSLTSLSLDAYPSRRDELRNAQQQLKQQQQPQQPQQSEWDTSNLYDNHRLTSAYNNGENQRFSSNPNDTPFSLDDLPPPPEDLLDTVAATSPFPTSTTPYKQLPVAPSPPREFYDQLPPRVSRYKAPVAEHAAQHASPLSNQSPLPCQLERNVSRPLDRKLSGVSRESPAPQSDLLAAIRAGINLRPMKKAQGKTPSPPQPALFHDVASILQRRKFLIGDMCDGASDSESESEGEWDDEDDSWN